MKECKYNKIGDFCENPDNKTGICDIDNCPKNYTTKVKGGGK